MKNLLQLNTSIFGADGQSSRLADAFVEQLRTAEAFDLTFRDLGADPVPHLTAAVAGAAMAPLAERTPAQRAEAALADTLIDELAAADVIVLGLPMYNFSVPSALKAWFDHVARAGTTFRYTASGPEGLLGDKKVYVFAARGGTYAGTDADLQTPYIRQFFGLLGIEDIEFVYAEGLNLGEDSKQAALAKADTELRDLAA